MTVTVYCHADAHPDGAWEREYNRDGEDTWRPDGFDTVGGRRRSARRGGGLEHLDATGRPVASWDTGRGGMSDTAAMDRLTTELDRAQRVAGTGVDDMLSLGHRFLIRCPECGDGCHANGTKVDGVFNILAQHGITRISVAGLRARLA